MFNKKKINKDLEKLERQVTNLTKLVDINSIINSTLDIGRLLTVVMEIIKEIMDTEASTLLLFEDDSRDLVFKVALGEAGEDLVEKYRVKLGQGIAGWVAETRKALLINDVYSDRRFDPDFDRMTGFRTNSMLCTPLLFKGKLLGVIQAINPVNRPEFIEDDLKLFNVFANQAALAVQNAIYFQNALEEERIKSELLSAKAIQEALIPDIDMQLGDMRIAAKSQSAREIGGEFHSLVMLDDDHVGIALGDLHEKGIPGGIHASLVTGALKALARIMGKTPYRLLGVIHDAMHNEMRSISSASIFYGVIDLGSRNLRFFNAGVAYPILVRDGIARYLRFGKRSIGADMSNSRSVAVSLRPGDIFVIISDGIIKMKNRTGKQLGLKSIMDFLQSRGPGLDNIIGSLIEFAVGFAGEAGTREDISIITLKVLSH